MSAVHPRSTSDPPTPWDDHDQYPAMRGHSNGNSQHLPHGPNRQRNGYGVNGEKAVPVPGFGNGMDRKSSVSHGQPLFDMARSPPTATSKSEFDLLNREHEILKCSRHQACPLQVLPPRDLPGRHCMSLLAFDGSDDPASSLQILHEGTVFLCKMPCFNH